MTLPVIPMNEKASFTEYVVETPTSEFAIGFDYEEGVNNLHVRIDDVPIEDTIYEATLINPLTIQIVPDVPSGIVRINRETDIDENLHKFSGGALFNATSMDENFEQIRNSQQDLRDELIHIARAEQLQTNIDIEEAARIDADLHALRIPLTDPDLGELPSVGSRAGKFVAFDTLGQPIVSLGTGADVGLRADLAADSGSALVGFKQSGASAVPRTLQSKARERLTPYDYGAAGTGMTDDTEFFRDIESEQTTQSTVDLAGGTYSLESTWVDPVNGAGLTKDYINGNLVVDGRPLVFDRTRGFADSAASVNRLGQASTTKVVAIKRDTQNQYQVWRPLGGHYWQQMILRRTTTGIPLNWQETRIKQVFGYIPVDTAAVTYSGTWATETGTTRLTDNSGNLYINGRGAQATAAGDYVDITYNGGGDIYVIYASRTSGNFVNVLLNGSQDFLVLPDDGAGNKYFDSYATPDLQYKKVVKIATGVPTGSHTIRLTVSASKNGASTGGRFVLNAISFDNAELSPAKKETDATVWATGQAVKASQVRKYGTNYYYATGAGTTGATPPTHTSGTVSDGAVSWTFRAITSYDLVDSAIHVAGSQLEYAYEMQPTGATAQEDVGGALHGNEVQTSLKIYVSNLEATLADGQWLVGDLVSIKEVLYSTHSEIGGGTTPVIHTTIDRIFKRQWVELHHKHTLAMANTLGYFYPHMYPLLHYHGAANKYAVRKVWSPSDGDRLCADFYNQANPFVGRTKDTLMIAYGDCLQPNGGGGVPTGTAAPLQFAAWLSVDPSSVDSYAKADSLFAAKAMNTSGADVSAGGFSSMTSKMYFERYSARTPRALPSGYTFDCFARYGLDLIIN